MKTRFLIFLIPLLIGCTVGMGKKVNTAYVSSIKECVTTEKEVIKNLGEPNHENHMGNFRQLVWYRSEAKVGNIFNPKTKTQNVMVAVDTKGRVVSVGTNPIR